MVVAGQAPQIEPLGDNFPRSQASVIGITNLSRRRSLMCVLEHDPSAPARW